MLKKILLLFYSATIFCGADLIIFSYDRALQLYALLESVEKYVTGLDQVSLIYRCSNDLHYLAYQEVLKRFSTLNIRAIKQSNEPRKDFKPLLLQELHFGSSKYLLMAVDDIIITDNIDLNKCIKILEKDKNIFGFYLRLGENITHADANKKTPKPVFIKNNDTIIWSMKKAKGDWGYSNSVDFVLYRKQDIISQFIELEFSSPNTLEARWHSKFRKNRLNLGIAFQESKLINIPANLVQEDWHNHIVDSYTAERLLDIFNQGLKIDIDQFKKIKPWYLHMDLYYKFVERA